MSSETLLTLSEHSSWSYGPRTHINAKTADVTVAFAVDFTTFGEILTYKAAGGRYVQANMLYDTPETVSESIAKYCLAYSASYLNIAGNGIYTLYKQGINQRQVNQFVYDTLKLLVDKHPGLITSIRSGGQTGVDWAGLVAGYALGIKTTGLWPASYRMRATNKRDYTYDPEALREWIMSDADEVKGARQ